MVVVLVMVVTVGVIVAGALAGYLGEHTPGGSAGLGQGVTLSDVVEDPARHEGRRVRISGEWAENEYFEPERAEEVIVLGDDAGNRLLVVPKLGVEVPAMDESTAVVVEGVVRLPDRTRAEYPAPDGLMRSADGDVAPVMAATDVSLVAGSDEGRLGEEADEATVAQLLADRTRGTGARWRSPARSLV